MRQEMSENYFQVGNRLQGTKIRLLSGQLVGIRETRIYQGSKLFDLIDAVAGKHKTTEFGEIEPAIGSIFQGSIIKIEAVDIDICFQKTPSWNTEAAHMGGFAPFRRSYRGGICRYYNRANQLVKQF